MASTEEASSYTYDVFLSFRGEDTRCNFTDHLYNALRHKGIDTFIDDKVPRGEEISAVLVKAIQESRVSIIIFSENYASSRWCLDELVHILHCKASNQQMVRPIFYKVDPSDVRNQTGGFGEAFAKLDQCKYKDSMDKWRTALKEAADLSGWPFKDGEYESQFINKIVEELSSQALVHSYNLDVAKYPIGIESCVQDLHKLLDIKKNTVRMVGIWGTGGIGKTTIAKAVFNSISPKFEGRCFLADIRSNSIPHRGLAQLQETLLSNILGDSYLNVPNVDIGVSLIKKRMQRKKVVLILDDVSDLKQLDNLAPSSDCFGPGSRIIITTRDKRWLDAHQVDSIYEVKMLDDDQALELFSWNAFKCNGPPDDYLELAWNAVHYAQGLPLALIVLGSHLFDRSRDKWEAILDCCKGDPQIQGILRISYDALDYRTKELFLDIACFFKGNDIDDVTPILEACDHHPAIGMKLLVEKALIRIDTDEIWMHDLIEEMGKDIVLQEGEPSERSRLWNCDDVNHVLTDKRGIYKIKGIQVKKQWGIDEIEICLNAKSFLEMKNLRYFSSSEDVCYLGNIDFLSNKLRWLDWSECPIQSFPSNFHPKELVALNIPDSRHITQLWEGRKIFPNLTYMDLSGCASLMELPDFTGIPNLKELDLSGSGIKELHPSIGYIIGLEELYLENCENLSTLPCSIYGLQNLEWLILSKCSKLVTFPANTKSLHDNNGDGSLSLPKLEVFLMEGCNLSDCDFLMTLDCLETLTELDLSSNNFVSLPACISKFVNLETLDLHCCKSLQEIPELPPNLIEVDVSDCESVVKFSKLSNVLEGKESQEIDWINLWNCHRLCDNLGYNMDKLERIFLNNQENSPFGVVFPGNITAEVAKWFDCWENVIGKEIVPCNCNQSFVMCLWPPSAPKRGPCNNTCDRECSITISKNLKWENIGLAICVVFEEGKQYYFDYEISINEVCIIPFGDDPWTSPSTSSSSTSDQTDWSSTLYYNQEGCYYTLESEFKFKFGCQGCKEDVYFSSRTDSTSDHVWLRYITLPIERKSEVDDQKDCSSPYYMCRVRFVHRIPNGISKSCGVHLVCQNIEQR